MTNRETERPTSAERLSVISDHDQPPVVVTPPGPPKQTHRLGIPAGHDPLRDDFAEPPAPPDPLRLLRPFVAQAQPGGPDPFAEGCNDFAVAMYGELRQAPGAAA